VGLVRPQVPRPLRWVGTHSTQSTHHTGVPRVPAVPAVVWHCGVRRGRAFRTHPSD
jgi:hypothetical protein